MAYFFVLAGLEYAKSTDLTVGLTGVMLVGNVFGWYLIEKAGRRSTMVYGKSCHRPHNPSSSYTTA